MVDLTQVGTSPYFYHQTTYRSQLIRGHYYNSRGYSNLAKVAELNEYARALTARPAEMLTQYIPEGIDNVSVTTASGSEQLLDGWNKRHYSRLLYELIKTCLTFGHCFVERYDGEPYWRILTPRDVTEYIYDATGKMTSIKVEYMIDTVTITGEKVIDKDVELVQYNSTRSQKGESILVACWDSLAYFALTTHNMAQYDIRGASGFPWLDTSGLNLSKEQQESLAGVMDALDSKYGGYGPGELKFVGAAGAAIDFPAHLNEHRMDIVAATGFPMYWFNGVKVSGLGDADTEISNTNVKLRSIFSQFTEFIRNLVSKEFGVIVKELRAVLEDPIEKAAKEKMGMKQNEIVGKNQGDQTENIKGKENDRPNTGN